MRMKSIQAIFALLGLGSLGVLGSSTNLAKNFFESVKSSLATEVFFSEYEKESKKNSLAMPPDNDISGNESIEDTASTSTEIPEYILYDRMFSLIEKFREMAEKQASRGEEITAFQGYFEREADLNEWQVKILQDTSVEYVNAVRIVDSQAEIVIEQLRLQHPIGSMPDGGSLLSRRLNCCSFRSKEIN